MSTPEAIVIGTSAGALGALTAILPTLPADYPLPVIIVVHLPPDKKSVMAELFVDRCALPVKEVEDKEPIIPGTIYFAPPDYHLLVEKQNYLSLSNEDPVLFSRPSIDVLFESAADAYGDGLIGIVLSGANNDGESGVRAICAAGGIVLVENPETAYASAMPEAARAACNSAQVLRLDEIAAYLKTVLVPCPL